MEVIIAEVDISIIIVNWNTARVTCDCLQSVYQQTKDIGFEVIAVDNASSDNSVEMIKDKFPQVNLIENNENRGFAAANNQGMAIAKGRYVLLLNPDTVVLDGAIQKTVTYAESHPQYAAVGCQVWENDKVIQKTCFQFHTPWNFFCGTTGLARLFPGSRWLGGDKMLWWNRESEQEVEVVSGMFLLVRREVIEQIGRMDESFFIYAEEADWCYRMSQAGWKNSFWPGAKIIHLDGGSKSSGQLNVKMEVQKVKSLLILMRKHYGRLAELMIKGVIIVVSIFKWLLLAMVWLIIPNRCAGKMAKFAGILRYCITGCYPGLPS